MDKLSETRLLRLRKIIGDRNTVPPIEALIPVSRSTWWQGVKEGRFPAPIKVGNRITVWRARDIFDWISAAGDQHENPIKSTYLVPTTAVSRVRMDPEEIASALRGKKSGNGWIAQCPAHADKTPSLSIAIGNNAEVLVYCHAGCTQMAVLHSLRKLGLWSAIRQSGSPFGRTRPSIKPLEHPPRFQQQAFRIWSAAKPATSTVVTKYLTARSITVTPPSSLRFAELKHPSGGIWPAMVAMVTRGSDEKFMGVHRTFLNVDGNTKAPVEPSKMMLGPCSGGAVILSNHTDFLLIGEGIETCLSAMQATGYPAWAALSASGMRSLDLPKEVREVVVLADGDATGEAAARACAARWKNEGRRVRIAHPPISLDFNDLLNYKFS